MKSDPSEMNEKELGEVSGLVQTKGRIFLLLSLLEPPGSPEQTGAISQDTMNLGALSSLAVSVNKKQLLLQLLGKNNGAKFIWAISVP